MRDQGAGKIGNGVLLHKVLILFRRKDGIQTQSKAGIQDGEEAVVTHGIPQRDDFTRL